MRYLFFLCIPFLLFATPFKVATYNVENLFDAVNNGTEYEEFIPGKHGWSRHMAQIKLDHTAEAICDLDADIVALQEVENASVFHALQKRLKRVGCPYRYGAITSKKGAPIQVGLLSRFPLEKKKELRVSDSPYVRNILEVEADIDGYPLTLFVNHWKSKSRKGYESKRMAYAKRLEKRIMTMPAHKDYLILGDLNTNYNAYLTLPETLNDTAGRTGLNDVLHTTVHNTLLSKMKMQNVSKGWHYDPWGELPFKERWSHKFYGHRSTLDHILLPPSMFDGKGIDYVNDSFRVFRERPLMISRGRINRWEIKNGKHTGKGYSDHLPLFAWFDIKPYVPSAADKEQTVVKGTIEDLYKSNKITSPVLLGNVTVVLKRGRYAVVKQSPQGRGIFVFGAVQGLKEGKVYDMLVQEISEYNGLKEITALITLKEKGTVALNAYYSSLSSMRQNEVVRNITGVYRGGYLYAGEEKIALYFKNRRLIPKNGAKIKIAYAHLGYYKKLQLVIYSKKDFQIIGE